MRLKALRGRGRCVGTVSRGHSTDVLLAALLAAITLQAAPQAASAPEEDFRVYTEHPRIFLKAQRLRLLTRERQRQSMRWEQLDALMRGGAPMKEPGFALALYYAVSGDKAAGEKAIAWAMTGTDLRQLAIVFDWCHDLLGDARRGQLAARIVRLREKPVRDDVQAVRDRVLAAIAVADEDQDGSERVLSDVVRRWWRVDTAPRLVSGELTIAHADLFALEEIMHALRDNLRVDLRDNAGDYFTRIPIYEIASYYPAPFQGPDSDCYVPAFAGGGEPDPRRAILSRAADLSLVAYDSNALESQYVQGWVMQDRFMLRDLLGAPYEFLWGNPYQPGLSYFQLPLDYHNPISGALFIRSSWEDDAKWFGLVGREMQWFEDGHVKAVDRADKPMEVGDTQVVIGKERMEFESEGQTTYLVGLAPRHSYLVEADDEEMQELDTDRAGIIELEFPQNRKIRVSIHQQK
jgi:hypothetical protein